MTHDTGHPTPSYPACRPRRLRSSAWLRDMVAEHRLDTSDLILPAFVIEGNDTSQVIESMPGVERLSIDRLCTLAVRVRDTGIPAMALFPAVEDSKKNPDGAEALNPDNLVCRAIAAVKDAVPEIGLIADVALDPYTSHGHDGIMDGDIIANDATIEILDQQAVTLANAGADVIAPSDMMDGRIGRIRGALDAKKHEDVKIMSYAAKYASAFYGPFRDAVQSGDFLKGDKKTYQMDPRNKAEAFREIAMDIAEGADMVMVKPGTPYLDIIARSYDRFPTPLFAYHVSGEYAMLRAASEKGWLDYETCMMETLLAFKRAGCRGILTYCALDAAAILNSCG